MSAVQVAKPLQCTIQANDFHQRPRLSSGDMFEVEIFAEDGNKKVDAFVKSIKEQPGKYQLFFNLPYPGPYHMNCMLDGAHIKGSPFTIMAQ